MKAYYARPKNLYGSPQEKRDIALIQQLGYEVIDFMKPEIQEAAKTQGMTVFEPLVKRANALFFRAFPSGDISAGVGFEIQVAEENHIPVLELPFQLPRRILSVDDTRLMLAELGQR